jgi:molybdenum cofactor biosynthesis enzyme MoaA
MQMPKTADTWCRRISNARTIRIAGPNSEWVSYSPCCMISTPNSTIVSKEDLDRVQQNIVEYVHKQKSLVCASCIQREKIPNGKRSIRQLGDLAIPPDAPWGEIRFLSFQLDIRCNAACVMCGPEWSTLWQQELGRPVTVTEKKATETLSKFCEWVDWSAITCLHFSGGEPLLTTSHEKILANVPDLSKVELRYQTNGSVAPSAATLEIWKTARVIKMEISLDGTDEQYEYIRHPLKWAAVENNVAYMAEFLEENGKEVEIHINCTVNPLNLLYLNNLDRWYQNMSTKYQSFKTLEYNMSNHESWGLHAITPRIFETFRATHGSNHAAMSLFQNFTFDKAMRERLKNNLVELDLRRKLNWGQVFSRYENLLND